MTREETIKVLAVLKAAYPAFYRGMKADELNGIVNLWASQFEGDDYKTVGAAVQAHIATDTKGYPPHIGAIKEAIRKITQPDEMSEMEAWGYVASALRNSGYNSVAEFDKLPPVVRRIVGSPSQLREWAMMDSDTVQSVVQSNFMRSYRVRAQSEREYLALPESVRELMGQLAGSMAIPALKESDRSYDIRQLESEIEARYLNGD